MTIPTDNQADRAVRALLSPREALCVCCGGTPYECAQEACPCPACCEFRRDARKRSAALEPSKARSRAAARERRALRARHYAPTRQAREAYLSREGIDWFVNYCGRCQISTMQWALLQARVRCPECRNNFAYRFMPDPFALDDLDDLFLHCVNPGLDGLEDATTRMTLLVRIGHRYLQGAKTRKVAEKKHITPWILKVKPGTISVEVLVGDSSQITRHRFRGRIIWEERTNHELPRASLAR
jgi:hypothetical protein